LDNSDCSAISVGIATNGINCDSYGSDTYYDYYDDYSFKTGCKCMKAAQAFASISA